MKEIKHATAASYFKNLINKVKGLSNHFVLSQKVFLIFLSVNVLAIIGFLYSSGLTFSTIINIIFFALISGVGLTSWEKQKTISSEIKSEKNIAEKFFSSEPNLGELADEIKKTAPNTLWHAGLREKSCLKCLLDKTQDYYASGENISSSKIDQAIEELCDEKIESVSLQQVAFGGGLLGTLVGITIQILTFNSQGIDNFTGLGFLNGAFVAAITTVAGIIFAAFVSLQVGICKKTLDEYRYYLISHFMRYLLPLLGRTQEQRDLIQLQNILEKSQKNLLEAFKTQFDHLIEKLADELPKSLKAELDKLIASMNDAIKVASTSMTDAVKPLNSSISLLKDIMNDIKTAPSGLTDELKDMLRELKGFSSTLTSLTTSLQSAAKEVKKLTNASVYNSSFPVHTSFPDLTKFNDALKLVLELIEKQEKSYAGLTEFVGKVFDLGSSAKQNLNTITNNMHSLESDISNLKTQLASLNISVNSISSNVGNILDDIKTNRHNFSGNSGDLVIENRRHNETNRTAVKQNSNNAKTSWWKKRIF